MGISIIHEQCLNEHILKRHHYCSLLFHKSYYYGCVYGCMHIQVIVYKSFIAGCGGRVVWCGLAGREVENHGNCNRNIEIVRVPSIIVRVSVEGLLLASKNVRFLFAIRTYMYFPLTGITDAVHQTKIFI